MATKRDCNSGNAQFFSFRILFRSITHSCTLYSLPIVLSLDTTEQKKVCLNGISLSTMVYYLYLSRKETKQKRRAGEEDTYVRPCTCLLMMGRSLRGWISINLQDQMRNIQTPDKHKEENKLQKAKQYAANSGRPCVAVSMRICRPTILSALDHRRAYNSVIAGFRHQMSLRRPVIIQLVGFIFLFRLLGCFGPQLHQDIDQCIR